MEISVSDAKIVDGYIGLLDNLSSKNKLDLISKLSASVKTDLTNRTSSFRNAFGSFESEKTAEEIIDEIQSSRVSTREIESF